MIYFAQRAVPPCLCLPLLTFLACCCCRLGTAPVREKSSVNSARLALKVDKHFMLRFTIDVKTLRCLTLEFCMEVFAVVRDVRAGLLRHHRLRSCDGRRGRLFLAVLLPPLPLERHLVRVEPRPRPMEGTTQDGFMQPGSNFILK